MGEACSIYIYIYIYIGGANIFKLLAREHHGKDKPGRPQHRWRLISKQI
jgi:hypothetical protein